jgi:hypothetical protein
MFIALATEASPMSELSQYLVHVQTRDSHAACRKGRYIFGNVFNGGAYIGKSHLWRNLELYKTCTFNLTFLRKDMVMIIHEL